MGLRTHDLEPGDRWWAPRDLVWDAGWDADSDWVEFKVIAVARVDAFYVDVTVELDGKQSTHRLDAEIGICLVEDAE
jgi:hypothetical protein